MSFEQDNGYALDDVYSFMGKPAAHNGNDVLVVFKDDYEDTTIAVRVSDIPVLNVGDTIVLDTINYKVVAFDYVCSLKQEWIAVIEEI